MESPQIAAARDSAVETVVRQDAQSEGDPHATRILALIDRMQISQQETHLVKPTSGRTIEETDTETLATTGPVEKDEAVACASKENMDCLKAEARTAVKVATEHIGAETHPAVECIEEGTCSTMERSQEDAGATVERIEEMIRATEERTKCTQEETRATVERIKRIQEEIRATEERTKRLNAEIAIKQKRQEDIMHPLSKFGLPMIRFTRHGYPVSVDAASRPPAVTTNGVFNSLTDIRMADHPKYASRIWMYAPDWWREYRTGTAIMDRVKDVIADVLSTFSIDLSIMVRDAVLVKERRTDICIIWAFYDTCRIPIGLCEARVPVLRYDNRGQLESVDAQSKDNPLNDPNFLGRMHDNLRWLRSVYGVDVPFGIFSTYLQWRICWLDDEPSNAVAMATEDDVIHIRSADDRCASRIGDGQDLRHDTAGQMASVATDTAADPAVCRLRVSPVYDLRGNATLPAAERHRELLSMLASVLLKMSRAMSPHPSPSSIPSLYMKLHPTKLSWEALPSNYRLQRDQFVGQEVASFIVLQDLGHGTDGRALLAGDEQGRACVLKFAAAESRHVEPKEMFGAEAAAWRKLWDIHDVRIQALLGSVALVMPWVDILSEAQWDDAAIQDEVRAAVRAVAKKGMDHGDMVRRHVGHCPLKQGAMVFIDLTRAHSVPDPKLAEESMLQSLGLHDLSSASAPALTTESHRANH